MSIAAQNQCSMDFRLECNSPLKMVIFAVVQKHKNITRSIGYKLDLTRCSLIRCSSRLNTDLVTQAALPVDIFGSLCRSWVNGFHLYITHICPVCLVFNNCL